MGSIMELLFSRSRTIATGVVGVVANAYNYFAVKNGWPAMGPEEVAAFNTVLVFLMGIFLRKGIGKAAA